MSYLFIIISIFFTLKVHNNDESESKIVLKIAKVTSFIFILVTIILTTFLIIAGNSGF